MAGVTALVGPRIHVPLFAQRGRVDSLGTRQGELYPGELGGRLFQGEEHNAWTRPAYTIHPPKWAFTVWLRPSLYKSDQRGLQ